MPAADDMCELLNAARQGSADAIGKIFEIARGHLLLLADRQLPADLRGKIGPSDIVQETAVDMHRDFPRFTGKTAEECFAWLRGILRHNATDAVRHYRTSLRRDVSREVSPVTSRGHLAAASIGEPRRTPDDSAIRREEAAVLHDIMMKLPSEYRHVLQLRYWGGLSFVDIATQIGRSADATRKLWYRAVQRLQRELAAD